MKMDFRTFVGILIFVVSATSLRAQSPMAPDTSAQIKKAGSLESVTGLGVDNSKAPTTPNVPFSISVRGPSPWRDIKAYGGRPRIDYAQTARAKIQTSNSTIVDLTNGPLDFVDGDGIVVWRAGRPTTQITPAAPTVTSPRVSNSANSGSSTISYQCVGVDALGGLTAASPTGSVMTSGVFGNLPVPISSISRASNVVTVNFSSPINAAPNRHIIISGVTGGVTSFNGLFLIASAPSNSQITFAQDSPDDESGTVSKNSTGRLVNAFNVTAISREGNTVTVTTDEDHNFLVGTLASPTIVIIDGVTPFEFNGQYVLASVPRANQFTFQMGNTGSLKGTAFGTATVWEHALVSCPTPIPAPTVQYYVYGNSGGSMGLIGKTLFGENTLKDWGPWIMHGYKAPGYVPTTPPGAAQNQMYVGTIISGAGTTALTVFPNVPSAIISTTALHDDGVALAAAASAASANSSGSVFISPSPAANAYYVINSPATIPLDVGLVVSGGLIVNETITLGGYNRISVPWTGTEALPGGPFPLRAEQLMSGLASPQLFNSTGSITIDGIALSGDSNGQNSIYFLGPHNFFSNCAFNAAGPDGFTQSASIPVVLAGGGFMQHFENTAWSANSAFGNTPALGQPYNAPPIPWLWMKTVQPTIPLAGLIFDGDNTGLGRGIMLDFGDVTNGSSINYGLKNVITFQAPLTPFLMLYGQSNTAGFIKVSNVDMDSHFMAVVANWNVSTHDVYLEGNDTTGASPLVTGLPIANLTAFNNVAPIVGQNADLTNNPLGPLNVGSGIVTIGSAQHGRPLNFSAPNNYPAFWEYPTITGVAAKIIPGTGSEPSGTWTFCITAVGWNEGESAPSCTTGLLLSGNQVVRVTWNTLSNVRGYNVYGGIGGYVRQNSSLISGPPFDFSIYSNYAGAPQYSGTGLPLIDASQVAAPLIRLVNGRNKVDLTTGILRGDRAQTLLDASGSIPVLIYTTPSVSTNSSISPTTMITAGPAGNLFRFSAYISQTTPGADCKGHASIQVNLIFTDPGASSPGTLTVNGGQSATRDLANSLPTAGSGAAGDQLVYTTPTMFFAKGGTPVQYSTTLMNDSGCSSPPSYKLYPALEQLK
jgi:hypothetical protein